MEQYKTGLLNETIRVPTGDDERISLATLPDGPVVVIIRHGKTEHNKLGLFTGWEDAPLAPEGVREAARAGELLAAHGIAFDVVYASWLSRSIRTAWIVLDRLDSLWLPIVKSWRLNERMYGALTGLSKAAVRSAYGERRFRAWRRGYRTRPPAVDSFSRNYPGNDLTYRQHARDVRFSARESLVRSLAAGRPQLHRKLPKTESLYDCMKRTVPYWNDVIAPRSVARGRSVLISSSENAIRGLLMHLCDVPVERIADVEIPTGVPLLYDPARRRIRLLDDGEPDPLSRYDFGAGAELLFGREVNDALFGSPDPPGRAAVVEAPEEVDAPSAAGEAHAARPSAAAPAAEEVRIEALAEDDDAAPAWFDEALRQREEDARRHHVATVELETAP